MKIPEHLSEQAQVEAVILQNSLYAISDRAQPMLYIQKEGEMQPVKPVSPNVLYELKNAGLLVASARGEGLLEGVK